MYTQPNAFTLKVLKEYTLPYRTYFNSDHPFNSFRYINHHRTHFTDKEVLEKSEIK